jgi:hypothetical protein
MANPTPKTENLTNAGKGRPSQGRSRIQLSLSPDVIDRLGEVAKSIGCTRPEAADLLLRSAMGLPIDSKKPKVDEKIQSLNTLLNNLKRIQQRIDDHELRWPSMAVPIGMIKDETIASHSLLEALDGYGPFVALLGAVEQRVDINKVIDIKQATEGGHIMYLIPGCEVFISRPCQFIVAIEPMADRS